MRRWWLGPLAAAVLAAVVGTAVVIHQGADGTPRVALTPTPTTVPEVVRTPLLRPADGTAPMPSSEGLRQALLVSLAHPLLRGRTSYSVVDVATGKALLERNAQLPAVPASTAKLATAMAALSVLPPDQRLVTRVLAGAPGDVVLVGGGDPTLVPPGQRAAYPPAARLVDVARQLARLRPRVRRVFVDDGLFAGPRLGAGWKQVYVTDRDVAPVSALELHGRAPLDPALDVGRTLAKLLHVTAPVTRAHAAAGAKELARVSSAPLGDLVETMLTTSDNNLAEALGRHIALAAKQAATFDGEVAATRAALEPLLRQLGLGPQALALRDASGLSTLDRVQPGAMARLIALAARDPRFARLLSGLPIAGFDGTLADRYRTGATAVAAGQVRAKTGTLAGVSALAGLVRTKDGRLLAFDLTVNGLPEKGSAKAPAALDAVAAALAACGCP